MPHEEENSIGIIFWLKNILKTGCFLIDISYQNEKLEISTKINNCDEWTQIFWNVLE